jgi:hypothetical protein
MSELYKQVDIWRFIKENEGVIYRCFQRLSDGSYTVQSADYVRYPIDEQALQIHKRQLIELFVNGHTPFDARFFPTLGEAIKYHDDAFHTDWF